MTNTKKICKEKIIADKKKTKKQDSNNRECISENSFFDYTLQQRNEKQNNNNTLIITEIQICDDAQLNYTNETKLKDEIVVYKLKI